MYLLHQNIGFLIIRYMESIGLTQEIFILIPILIIILLSWGVTFLLNNIYILYYAKWKNANCDYFRSEKKENYHF